jgi:DNA-binding NarL/FixJ family response regulator
VKLAERPPLLDTSLRVALVDSRPERRQVMRHVVEGGVTGAVVVVEADTADDAIAGIGAHDVEIVVVEIQMPVDDGIRTVTALRQHYPELGIIVCSFRSDPEIQSQARQQGADRYFCKPVGRSELNDAFLELTAARRLVTDAAPIDALLASSPSAPQE